MTPFALRSFWTSALIAALLVGFFAWVPLQGSSGASESILAAQGGLDPVHPAQATAPFLATGSG